MSSFLNDAERIFEVASQSSEPENLTIRLNPEGGIHVIAGSDYSYFSGTTYRVRRGQGVVEVQGSAGGHMCLLRTAQAVGSWMTDRPMYMVA
jgi:hypothetical protein